MLTASLGYKTLDEEMILLTYWPTGAGDLPGGGFDVDAWEESQTHVCKVTEADPREAWKEAYRLLRLVAREAGGLEWLPDMVDCEPCPLPDRRDGECWR